MLHSGCRGIKLWASAPGRPETFGASFPGLIPSVGILRCNMHRGCQPFRSSPSRLRGSAELTHYEYPIFQIALKSKRRIRKFPAIFGQGQFTAFAVCPSCRLRTLVVIQAPLLSAAGGNRGRSHPREGWWPATRSRGPIDRWGCDRSPATQGRRPPLAAYEVRSTACA